MCNLTRSYLYLPNLPTYLWQLVQGHMLQCWDMCRSSQQLGRWKHVPYLRSRDGHAYHPLFLLVPRAFPVLFQDSRGTKPYLRSLGHLSGISMCPRRLRYTHRSPWATVALPARLPWSTIACAAGLPLATQGFTAGVATGNPRFLLCGLPLATKSFPRVAVGNQGLS